MKNYPKVNYVLAEEISQTGKILGVLSTAVGSPGPRLGRTPGGHGLSQQTQNIGTTFVQRRPTLVRHCTNVVPMFCVYWGGVADDLAGKASQTSSAPGELFRPEQGPGAKRWPVIVCDWEASSGPGQSCSTHGSVVSNDSSSNAKHRGVKSGVALLVMLVCACARL